MTEKEITPDTEQVKLNSSPAQFSEPTVKTANSTVLPGVSRKHRRAAATINNKYISILGHFYSKASDSQLTDDEIRDLFKKCNAKWVNICVKNGLDKNSESLFAKEISTTWEKKREKAEKK